MFAGEAFKRELSIFLNEEVRIEMDKGGEVTGVLKAYDPDNLSVILEDALIDGASYKRVMINGASVVRVFLKEKKVDLERLRDMLDRSFPRLVEYKKELGVILVMNRIRVTEKGVEGDEGPATERVKRIYEKFMAGVVTD